MGSAQDNNRAVDDLTGLLYRNRQRLLAIRAAINELEVLLPLTLLFFFYRYFPSSHPSLLIN